MGNGIISKVIIVISKKSVPSLNTAFLLRAVALDRQEGYHRSEFRRYIQSAKSDDPFPLVT